MLRLFCLLTLLVSSPVFAQTTRVITMQLSSGTGFYINSQGYLLTNAHVVPGCTHIAIHGGATTPRAATLIARDEKLDLAVLRVDTTPPGIAALRAADLPPVKDEPLLLAGFPGNTGVEGHITLRVARLISAKGPTGEPQWLQFSDAAAHGNSGGPLLDGAGNVLGVVVAKAQLITYNQATGEQLSKTNSDVAISLSATKNFLNRNGIPYLTSRSQAELPAATLADQARKYIVNVLCRVS